MDNDGDEKDKQDEYSVDEDSKKIVHHHKRNQETIIPLQKG